jgi:hypothetical protein
MLIRRVSLAFLFCVAASVGVLVGLPANVPGQEEVESCQLAIPSNVTIIVGEDLVIVTGKSSAISTPNCAPGTPQPHSAVIVDPGSGRPAQNSAILIFVAADATDPPNGTRFRITDGPSLCSGDLHLYTGMVE